MAWWPDAWVGLDLVTDAADDLLAAARPLWFAFLAG